MELTESGRSIKSLSDDFGVSGQSIYTWRRQARIDVGTEVGLTTTERGELSAMRKRVRELEAELAIHRRAAEVLKERADP